ncbi:hypothetical protein GCM10011519_28010 [Marmoricola endophyticus]|uniref:DUF202 domain-containing protein n=1 Tax=Marmoricola endophyticus TaxID=2040280 RepID=A0A917BN00_9ACTN|nr:DUF202 domain-containing protein [Marmoricola endophyticus]GGF52445.1 hypothetical protein GCM10011519_28010 [Marmoricola endophyticus]
MGLVPSDLLDRDPGLALERTSLAWNRTALALLVNGVLAVVHHEGGLPQPVGLTLLTASLVIAAAASTHAAVRGRRVRRSTTCPGPSTVAVVALGTALTALCLGTAVAVVVSVPG